MNSALQLKLFLNDFEEKYSKQNPELKFYCQQFIQMLPSICISLDPEIRDTLGYHCLHQFLFQEDICKEYLPEMTSLLGSPLLLHMGLDEPSDNKKAVGRSFAALYLGDVISMSAYFSHKINAPVIEDVLYNDSFEKVLLLFQSEKNTVGYHEKYGWVHCVAHIADAVASYLSHPLITQVQTQSAINSLIAYLEKRETGFLWSEGKRLAVILYEGLQGKYNDLCLETFLSSIEDEQEKLHYHFKIQILEQVYLCYCKALQSENKTAKHIQKYLGINLR